MYLEELFEKYAEWKILRFFLDNPNTELHVKELSRRLKVSPGTASVALNKAADGNLLKKKVVGNIHLYSLNEKQREVKKLQEVVKTL